jgi:hypothetical protein
MVTMTWIEAPAALLGLGGAVVRPCTGIDVAVSAALRGPVAPVTDTGLPIGGTAVRLRQDFPQLGTDFETKARTEARTKARTTAFAHNYIAVENDGTPLGIHPSRRPQS